jgi:triosephosphate isomerase
MNLTIPCAVSLAESMRSVAEKNAEADVAVFPSFVALWSVGNVLARSSLALGAQDVFWKESGAYTGEISPKMLSDVGCRYCIVGHSERRGRFGVADDSPPNFFADTNETVARKLSALVYVGITPILCVGETAEERSEGHTEAVLETQLTESLAYVSEGNELVIAYEPVWAIGTGEVCDPDEAARACAFISHHVQTPCRVLYGGSVKKSNAKALFEKTAIEGALVGGASLDAEEFAAIIASAK